MKLEHLIQNLEKLYSTYSAGEPALAEQIAEVERRLNIELPAQVKMFYQHFNGLAVEDPPFKILRLSSSALSYLVYCTFPRSIISTKFASTHLN
jgi:hypothetical protein